METLSPKDKMLRAFRAADAFAVEAYRASRGLQGPHRDLATEISRVAVQSGGALVAAAAEPPASEAERTRLERAREALVEGHYYLYLARRCGALDLRAYRSLTVRQGIAVREIDAMLRPGSTSSSRRMLGVVD